MRHGQMPFEQNCVPQCIGSQPGNGPKPVPMKSSIIQGIPPLVGRGLRETLLEAAVGLRRVSSPSSPPEPSTSSLKAGGVVETVVDSVVDATVVGLVAAEEDIPSVSSAKDEAVERSAATAEPFRHHLRKLFLLHLRSLNIVCRHSKYHDVSLEAKQRD
ncbi:hypothetical protein FF38_09635 [Lucilia cuprina]|uniref:Uncharacterized protein n=1 Tax=Lucilia cuprina TaxID=7375 RepID=A0A0L0BZF4_LUCCU|nr:hypothetical protein FF38_09635 [Lucilia cuprina]